MSKLYRLVAKFQGDNVTITTLRRAAHGRYALHLVTKMKRGELRENLSNPEFQERHLMVPKRLRDLPL